MTTTPNGDKKLCDDCLILDADFFYEDGTRRCTPCRTVFQSQEGNEVSPVMDQKKALDQLKWCYAKMHKQLNGSELSTVHISLRDSILALDRDEKRRVLLEALAVNCRNQWNVESAEVLGKLQERESQILGALLPTQEEA